MSQTKKHPYDLAAPMALKIAGSLERFCVRVFPAGSVRRVSEWVGDIELVAEPIIETQPDLFGDDADTDVPLLGYLDELMDEGKIKHAKHQAWGNRQRKFIVTTLKGIEYQVDLYMCEANVFGSIYMIRTGSDVFSKWMVTKQSQGGAMPENMKQDERRLWLFDKGDWVHVDTYEEVDYFNAIKLPWIPPEERQDNRWHEWLAETNRWLESAGGVMTWK